MTFYAYYDSTVSSPSPVLGWYDTGAITYPSLPGSADLLALSDDQWAARLTGYYAVTSGALVTYTPPYSPSISQQALAALGAGLTINSTGTPAIDAVYAVTPNITTQVSALIAYVQQNGTFPSGLSSLVWYDITGTPHTFPDLTVAKNWATAVFNYVFALNTIIQANSGTLPSSTTTIP